jgi:hypothetical protein
MRVRVLGAVVPALANVSSMTLIGRFPCTLIHNHHIMLWSVQVIPSTAIGFTIYDYLKAALDLPTHL